MTVDAFYALLGTLAGVGALIIAWLEKRTRAIERRTTANAEAITQAVDHLSEVLMAKLETKETVSHLSERVSRLEGEREGRHQ